MTTTARSLALATLLVAAPAHAAAPAVRTPVVSLPAPQVTFEYGEASHTLPYEVQDAGSSSAETCSSDGSRPGGRGRRSGIPRVARSASTRPSTRSASWPGGVIPYQLTADYLAVHGRETWQDAVDHIHARTELRLVERTDPDELRRGHQHQERRLQRGAGVPGARRPEHQPGPGLRQPGGPRPRDPARPRRPHEHQRHDRDQFIEVLTENIQVGLRPHFEPLQHHRYMPPSSSYDYESVMHYGPRSSSANGRPTMRVRTPPARPGQPLGRGNSLTHLDVTVVNYLVHLARRGHTGRYWSETPFGPRYPLDGPFGIY